MLFFRSFFIAIVLAFVGTSAQALKGVGTVDNLEFITQTDYGGYALCHHVEHIAFKGIPLTSESVGYALAGNRCDAEAFISLTTEEFVQGQADGHFPVDLPAEPSLSTAQVALNYVAVVGIVIVGLGGLLWKLGYLRRPERIIKNTGIIGTGLAGAKDIRVPLSQKAQTRMLAAVCYVAQADGSVEGDEVISIGKMIAKFTGEKVNFSSVVDMIHHTAGNTDLAVLDTLGDGIKPRECAKILEAVVTVAQSDNDIHPNEVAIINRIAAALGLPAPDLSATPSQQPVGLAA